MGNTGWLGMEEAAEGPMADGSAERESRKAKIED